MAVAVAVVTAASVATVSRLDSLKCRATQHVAKDAHSGCELKSPEPEMSSHAGTSRIARAGVKRSESAFAHRAAQARIRVASIVTLLTPMPTISATMSATVG
jgi:hypothetical protein